MASSNWIEKLKSPSDPIRNQAISNAYIPIISSILVPGCIYYCYITWSHWQDERGLYLAMLASISSITALSYYLLRQHVLARKSISLGRLELTGLFINLLVYFNVLSYLLLHFEQSKLIYFALMAVIFSTTGVTLRVTIFSVFLSLATLTGSPPVSRLNCSHSMSPLASPPPSPPSAWLHC
ncbi:MAG: hypothetical protein KUA43_03600 [Hoeflea sp.]|uniref:hypothetical protein n=1 Tax=Hoeflea sp. TaxID=1940281 RepID=UPI001D48D886|nr:hypothetical protein [Hoeflea sp.]MBV1722508.1 hypothetical protein [Hoeflea sp.]MBV1761658.1 hypothetical protein [Hoeflea sp.]